MLFADGFLLICRAAHVYHAAVTTTKNASRTLFSFTVVVMPEGHDIEQAANSGAASKIFQRHERWRTYFHHDEPDAPQRTIFRPIIFCHFSADGSARPLLPSRLRV